jgi:hypothetical protein
MECLFQASLLPLFTHRFPKHGAMASLRLMARRRALSSPSYACLQSHPSIQHSLNTLYYLKTSKLQHSDLVFLRSFSNVSEKKLKTTLPKGTLKTQGDVLEQSFVNVVDVSDGFMPRQVIEDLKQAAEWNQQCPNEETTKSTTTAESSTNNWDYEFCRKAVHEYERHLTFLLRRLEENSSLTIEDIVAPELVEDTLDLLSAFSAERAVMALLKCKLHTSELSKRVREVERLIGLLGRTPLTDPLSLRLVEANGKAGNIGRVLALLNLRSSRTYPAVEKEFMYAVQAIQSAGLYMRTSRNILLGDDHQPDIDNPTRWLDAILLQMHKRGIPLTTNMANRMLNCYASTGRTSKASHFFYQLSKQPAENVATQEMPKFRQRQVRLRLKYCPPPNYYKVPSQSKDKLVAIPHEKDRKPKLDFEMDPHWSLPLTAAFSFADSLTHGACGHAPIALDLTSWNTLIKACCYRGALWRALQILQVTLPQQGIEPDTVSYNTILAGLARVVSQKAYVLFYVLVNTYFLTPFCFGREIPLCKRNCLSP